MARPYAPLAFANEFVLKSAPSGCVHMKLQKLVYLCYGWWLVEHNEPIMNEAPEVWRHGPVFSSLYDNLKGHGHRSITNLQRHFFSQVPDRIDDGDDEALALVDWVWERYGGYGQFALSDMTHQPNTPWYQTAQQFDFRVPRNQEIPVDVMRAHFRAIAADRGFIGNGG